MLPSAAILLSLFSTALCVEIVLRKSTKAEAGRGTLGISSSLRAEITVGTPPQSFLMALFMDRSDFWIPDSTLRYSNGASELSENAERCPKYCSDKLFCKFLCEQFCCDGGARQRNTFNSKTSSTYQKAPNRFSSTSSIKGFTGRDVVRLGDLGASSVVIQHALFGQATQLSSDFKTDITYDGWLGLAIPRNKSLSPIILQAHDQKAFSRPIFLIWLGLEAKDGAIAGNIWIGGYDDDHKHCGVVNAYKPLLTTGCTGAWCPEDGLYMIQADAMRIGDGSKFTAYGQNVMLNSFREKTGVQPAEDDPTGAKIAAAFGATMPGFRLPSCQVDVPDLTMTWGRIVPITYVLPGSSLKRTDSRGCYLNLELDGWSLGADFTRQYCQKFDVFGEMGVKRIGLAPLV